MHKYIVTSPDGFILPLHRNLYQTSLLLSQRAAQLVDLSIFCSRQHNMLSAHYAIAIPYVRLSVTRVDQSKTVGDKIMQFSPYSSPIPLVFAR